MRQARPLGSAGPQGGGLAGDSSARSGDAEGRGVEVAARPAPNSPRSPIPPRLASGRTASIFIVLPHGFGLGRCSGTSVNAPNRSVVFTAGHCVNEGGPRSLVQPATGSSSPATTTGCGPSASSSPSGSAPPRPGSTAAARTPTSAPRWSRATNAARSSATRSAATGSPWACRRARSSTSTATRWKRPSTARPSGSAPAPRSSATTSRPSSGRGRSTWRSTCDVTGGASGGGWTIHGNVLNGVTNYGYGDDREDRLRRLLRRRREGAVRAGLEGAMRARRAIACASACSRRSFAARRGRRRGVLAARRRTLLARVQRLNDELALMGQGSSRRPAREATAPSPNCAFTQQRRLHDHGRRLRPDRRAERQPVPASGRRSGRDGKVRERSQTTTYLAHGKVTPTSIRPRSATAAGSTVRFRPSGREVRASRRRAVAGRAAEPRPARRLRPASCASRGGRIHLRRGASRPRPLGRPRGAAGLPVGATSRGRRRASRGPGAVRHRACRRPVGGRLDRAPSVPAVPTHPSTGPKRTDPARRPQTAAHRGPSSPRRCVVRAGRASSPSRRPAKDRSGSSASPTSRRRSRAFVVDDILSSARRHAAAPVLRHGRLSAAAPARRRAGRPARGLVPRRAAACR